MSLTTKLFRNLLKFGMPTYLLLVIATAFHGWLSPWPPAKIALTHYPGQTPVLVGASYRSHHSLGQGSSVTSSRSYVLFPAMVSDPKIITFTQENGGALTSSESRFGLLFMLVWLVLCTVGTWWSWHRKVPPDNSFKSKALRDSA